MSEREQEELQSEVIDPVESDGGSETTAMNLESSPQPLDPPDGNGGTGGG